MRRISPIVTIKHVRNGQRYVRIRNVIIAVLFVMLFSVAAIGELNMKLMESQ